MGFLFKGSTTVVQAPQQSQTTYDIPDYLKEFQSSLLDRANVESRGAYQGYTQDRIAPLSTAETAAGGIFFTNGCDNIYCKNMRLTYKVLTTETVTFIF